MAEDVDDYFPDGFRIIVGHPCVNGKDDGTIPDISAFIEEQFTISPNPTIFACRGKLTVDRKISGSTISEVKVE